MKKKRKDDKQTDNAVEFGKDEDYYSSLDIASYTEMTGAVPTPPLNDAQAENYSDIVSVPQQCADHAGKQELRKSKRQERL